MLAITLLLWGDNAWAPSLRTRIAVVDTGINVSDTIRPYLCESGHIDLTHTDLDDRNGHGTNIAYIISRGVNPSKQCLVIVKWYDRPGNKAEYPDEVVKAAVATGAKIINMSFGGPQESVLEASVIRQALARGVTFVMAAGNDGQDLDRRCYYYPACDFAGVPGAHVVGALDLKGHHAYFSNYGRLVSDWAPGTDVEGGGHTYSGTSQAAANFTASLVRALP